MLKANSNFSLSLTSEQFFMGMKMKGGRNMVIWKPKKRADCIQKSIEESVPDGHVKSQGYVHIYLFTV